MKKKSFQHILKSQKHDILLSGMVTALLHFVITSMLGTPSYGEPAWLAMFILTVPSFAAAYFLPTASKVMDMSISVFIIFSSFSYGIITGFLASKGKISQKIGIVLVGLLILLSCFLLLMLGQSFAQESDSV